MIRSSLLKLLPGGWQKVAKEAAGAARSWRDVAAAASSWQEAERTAQSWQEAARSWEETAISHFGQQPPGAAFDQPATSLKKFATALEIKTTVTTITITTPIITTTAASLRTETQGETETQ